MNIHIKEPYQQPRELTLEQVQLQLQNGTLTPEALAWRPGLSEWVPVLSLPEISPVAPPPLPRESKKMSKKAVCAFFLVLFGILTASTGIGILLILAGVVMGVFASRDFKKHGDKFKGAGWLSAARILVLIVAGLLAIGFLVVLIDIVPAAYSKAMDKRNHSGASSNSAVQTSNAEAGFISEPTKNKTVTGSSIAYTYSVPSEWTIKTPVKPFDSVATSKGLVVGVVVEEKQYTDAEEVYKELLYKARKKNAYTITDPQWLTQDGQRWLGFSFITKEDEAEALWVAFIYTAKGKTLRFVFKTNNSPFKSDLATFREIFATFRFPTG